MSRLRKLRATKQVAAICYRRRGSEIEFLLVRTRGGRWIFPKGSAEAGLTHAEAAALEAFEEAGVHGRMQLEAFTHYVHQRGGKRRSAEVSTSAHLCEVTRLSRPRESYRRPLWFSPVEARLRLREGRNSLSGRELVRVVDRAVSVIRQRFLVDCLPIEQLRRVAFEDASPIGGSRPQSLLQSASPRAKFLLPAATSVQRGADHGEILEFRPASFPILRSKR